MKYIGPKCRLCRRENTKLFLKGEKCLTSKCPLLKKNYVPGGNKHKFVKTTEYGKQLREKQKAKRIYNLSESTFKKYFDKASKNKEKVTGEVFVAMLERRLDVIVFKAGFALSLAHARQLISHGFFLLNGKKVDISSILMQVNDKLSISSKENNSDYIKNLEIDTKTVPNYLNVDIKAKEITLLKELEEDDLNKEIDHQTIVEFYSR